MQKYASGDGQREVAENTGHGGLISEPTPAKCFDWFGDDT
jgi:hypothetical protein